jgi:glycosyltransferase involved in cell wall biosynthesis
LCVVFDATPLVSPWAHTSGVARWTRGVIDGLENVAPDWDVRLIAARKPAADAPNFTSVSLAPRLHRTLMMLRLLPAVERWVPEADVVIGSAFVPWPSRRASRVPVIHDLSFVKHPGFVSLRNRYFLRSLVKRSVREAELTVTVTRAMSDEIVSYYDLDPSRVAVVPNGFDPARFNPSASKPAETLVPERYLLFVGTLEPRKNLAGAIQAHAILRRARADVPTLVVVGKEGWGRGSWSARLRSAAAAGDVVYLGPVSDDALASLYVGAEMLVFPSFYEGFGLPVLEAMACGCPVVASDLPALREVAGDAAVYVDPNDPHSIASGVSSVFDDPARRGRLVTLGRDRAKIFTWRRAAESLVKAIERVLVR